MNIVKFQGEAPEIYYEFDKDSVPLGEGGMGRIYQGYRIDTKNKYQSIVAIKCIRPELVSNPTVLQRAQTEASVRLNHNNLIRMYGFFSGAEFSQYSGTYTPAYYISMERLIGVNLEDVLFRQVVTDRSGAAVPIAEELLSFYSSNKELASVNILSSLMDGISFLHQNGYIHRDIDPSNVMLTQEGYAKVIDFGICKKIGVNSIGGGLTKAGQFLGKISYAAPELILGDIANQGPATDIYALGIMLYQLLTGELPVSGSDQEVMNFHLLGKFDFSKIQNKKMRKVIAKATAKDYRERFTSVTEFQSALEATQQADQPIPVDTPSVMEQADASDTPLDKNTIILSAVLCFLAGLAIKILVMLF